MSERPLPVLYIAGAPRSGSTLLDRLLGQQGGLCSVGELHFIWQRSFAENQLCGCGTPFRECGFWSEVVRRAFGVGPRAFDPARASELKRAIERKRALPQLIAGRSGELAAYGQLLAPLYRAIAATSGAHALVDSSKDPRHGLILTRLPGIELHVVHLVRDPRAVAFSWRRRRIRPEVHWRVQEMPRERVTRTAARWTTHNALVEVLGRVSASYTRVRYEDLAADPRAVVAEILRERRCAAAPRAVGATFALEPAHTVAGNPMRFHTGTIAITPDEEWARAMRTRDRLLVTAAALPLLSRYRYEGWPRR